MVDTYVITNTPLQSVVRAAVPVALSAARGGELCAAGAVSAAPEPALPARAACCHWTSFQHLRLSSGDKI